MNTSPIRRTRFDQTQVQNLVTKYPRISGRLLAKLPLVLLLLCGLAGSTAWAQEADQFESLDREERHNINIFRQSSPSVVNIATQRAIVARAGDVALNIGRLPAGTGTGFVWDNQGHVVTNYHVVENADFVRVKFANNIEWDAQVLGSAPELDIAVLKINTPRSNNVPGFKFRPLAVGRSDSLQVGQKVFAIGNPFGLDQTLTSGIVSGLGREIDSKSGAIIRGVVQTDAAINPGNSGGPLLDSRGRLIGVNTAILSRSGSSAGIGFAIPVNTVRATVPLLISGKAVNRGYLGVTLAPAHISNRITDEGFVVLCIDHEGPVGDGMLRPTTTTESGSFSWGDVLVSLNGKKISSSESLLVRLQEFHVGDEVVLGVKRDGEYIRLAVRLTERPAKPRLSCHLTSRTK